MQTKKLAAVVAVLALAFLISAVTIDATPVEGQQSQQPPPRGAPPSPPNQPPQPPRDEPPAPRPEPRGQPINVSVEVTITDQTGSEKPIVKTVKLVLGDGQGGRVRSSAEQVAPWHLEIPLNVDALPRILPEGKINLQVSLQYDLPGAWGRSDEPPAAQVSVTKIQESLTLVLESGKPVVMAESADPLTDRKVSVEVRATVMK